MKLLNIICNLITFAVITSFFSFVIFKNYKKNNATEPTYQNQEKIIDCLENAKKKIDCIGEDILNIPVEEYKKQLNQFSITNF